MAPSVRTTRALGLVSSTTAFSGEGYIADYKYSDIGLLPCLRQKHVDIAQQSKM